MSALDDFKRFVADAETGSQYAKWAQQNPGELGRWTTFRDAVVAGQSPPPPTMTTPHGRELVDAAVETEHFRALEQPLPTPSPTANPVPPPASGAYLGAYTGTWDWSGFGTQAGKPAKLAMFGVPSLFTDTNDLGNLKGGLAAADQQGAVGVVDCMTSQTGTLADFAAGKYDVGIDRVAAACRAFGKPLVLRIDAEMNGGWYDFGKEIRASAAGPASFVAAWKRIVDRIRAGAANVAFHWCPNVDVDRVYPPLVGLYPGDAYVDWAGLTGYNHGNEAVDWLFDSTLAVVAALTQRPIMLGEVGSVDKLGLLPGTTAPTKAQWIADLLAYLKAHPQIRALCWFNTTPYETGAYWDWPIDSSPTALAAFQAFAASSYVVGR